MYKQYNHEYLRKLVKSNRTGKVIKYIESGRNNWSEYNYNSMKAYKRYDVRLLKYLCDITTCQYAKTSTYDGSEYGIYDRISNHYYKIFHFSYDVDFNLMYLIDRCWYYGFTCMTISKQINKYITSKELLYIYSKYKVACDPNKHTILCKMQHDMIFDPNTTKYARVLCYFKIRHCADIFKN